MANEPARAMTIPIDTGAGSASPGTTTTVLIDHDLSQCNSLRINLSLTKCATDAVDSLDVKLQSTTDGVVWDTRARFPLIAGNSSASTTAPISRTLQLQQKTTMTGQEEAYVSTGSAGGVELSNAGDGSVRHGPFPGILRTSAGRQQSWRVQFIVIDADADADYEGTLTIWMEK